MKKIIILIISIYASTVFAKNLCIDLFAATTKNRADEAEDAILKHLDDLVVMKFKIDSKDFGNENQYRVAVDYLVSSLKQKNTKTQI